MQMPTMDGVTLAKAIKNDSALRETVLLMLTATEQSWEAAEMETNGFAACLVKPFRQSELFDAVAMALVKRRKSEIPQQPLHESRQAERVIVELRAKRLHVLIAEDNEVNQEVAREILLDAGCTVDLVMTGAAAVEAVESQTYDLVLMDCQMPEMDGFEAARRIRSRSTAGSGRIPIIALTANAIAGDRERCIAAGMDEYVSKPVDPEALYAAVLSLLQPNHAPPPPSLAAQGNPIDLDSLLQRCRGKTQLVESLLGKFDEAVRTQLKELKASLACCDRETVARLAHTIKGSSANMSADSVSTAAAALEHACKSDEWDAAGDLLRDLEGRIQECLNYVPVATSVINERTVATAPKGARKAVAADACIDCR
jgi:CheY-like chemotaxis protein/HPt (histidine-containing phosphotransfer) domain-containing protein